MNQIERMTPGATIMMQPFAQRMAQYSTMSDSDLQRMGKEIYEQHATASLSHIYAQAQRAHASGLHSKISSMSTEQSRDRAALASTPWYRPFKKSTLKASISRRSAELAVVKSQYKETGAAQILASKAGIGQESPAMKLGNQAMEEIARTLETRQAERAGAMAAELRRRKAIQAQKQAEAVKQKEKNGPSVAMVMLNEMFDEIKERNEEKKRFYEREVERPRY